LHRRGRRVIGLACARALAMAGLQTIVLEAESRIGSGVSSRSSEVIHAGLYYAPDSLKARLCVQGRELLYGYLGERGLPHRRLGKLIVATEPAQEPALTDLRRRGLANGSSASSCSMRSRRADWSLRCAVTQPSIRPIRGSWTLTR